MTYVLTMLSIHSTNNSPICSLEGLKLETSALNFSCGGKAKVFIICSYKKARKELYVILPLESVKYIAGAAIAVAK